jgi:hypothetical protein
MPPVNPITCSLDIRAEKVITVFVSISRWLKVKNKYEIPLACHQFCYSSPILGNKRTKKTHGIKNLLFKLPKFLFSDHIFNLFFFYFNEKNLLSRWMNNNLHSLSFEIFCSAYEVLSSSKQLNANNKIISELVGY